MAPIAMLYIAGDSHANLFENDERFMLRTLGSATAFNLRVPNNRIHSREALVAVVNEMNKEEDWLILTVGEIDCRIHIYKQFKKHGGSITSSQLLANTVSAYGETLDWLQSQGIHFIVLGIAPPGRETITQEGFTYEMRAQYYREFNERMKNDSVQRHYPYVDLYSYCVGPDGMMRTECAMDNQSWQMHAGLQMKPVIVQDIMTIISKRSTS